MLAITSSVSFLAARDFDHAWPGAHRGFGAAAPTARAAVHASPASRQRTQQAFEFAYGLKFSEAHNAFTEATGLDASDPAPHRGLAALALMEALFSQGIATFEAFTGQVSSKSDIARPVVPAAVVSRFRAHADRAMNLAEQQLKQSATADAHYQVGATAALSAIYAATVEGRTFGSFGLARRAVRMMERAQALDPERREVGLVLGMSRYTVSTMSRPVRMLASLTGLSGGREEGLALLHEAASAGRDTEADALLVLMIVYNREGRHGDALTSLARLSTRFPSNRLFSLNTGATHIEGGNFAAAERALAAATATHDLRLFPTVLGEEALWHLKLGTARAGLGRAAEARADLNRVLTTGPRDWVRGRAHLELAKLALRAGDAAEARRHVTQGLQWSQSGGDGRAVDQLKELSRRVP